MRAGGRLEFRRPLAVGVEARKRSTVTAVKEKIGRSGPLAFVTVRHEYMQRDELAIIEEQDIVYRQPAPPKLAGTYDAPPARWQFEIAPTPALLFRYSAVTFNTHRIHYDLPYAIKEGYPGLVTQGTLIATCMLNGFERANPDKKITHFSYRGLHPLISPERFSVAGAIRRHGEAEAWAEQAGHVAHEARILYV